MARHRSLLKNISITSAQRSHSCRHDDTRIIKKGESRLTIKEGRDIHHYCLETGELFLKNALRRVTELLGLMNAAQSQSCDKKESKES